MQYVALGTTITKLDVKQLNNAQEERAAQKL